MPLPRAVKSVRRITWWRLAWIAVFALHAPITVNAFAFIWRDNASIPSWSSVLLLAASNLFFVLEIAFACSLRLVSDRRAAMTMFLIVLVLHVGVFERAIPALLAHNEVRWWLVLAGATACLAFCTAVLRAILVASLGDPHAAKHSNRRRYAGVSLSTHISRLISAFLSTAPLRAPPASCA